MKILNYIFLFFLVGSSALYADNVELTASLQPQKIQLGETALLTIQVKGDSASHPTVYRVDGLQIVATGTSSQLQWFNGAGYSSVVYSYNVQPERAGTFNLPPVELRSGGNLYKTAPLQLMVEASNAPSHVPPHTAQVGQESSDEEQDGVASGKEVFAILQLPKDTFYVGETVPVEIRAYFSQKARVQLETLPALNSDAFSLGQLNTRPQEASAVIRQKPYLVLTWHTCLSALREGDFSLGLHFGAMVLVKTAAPPGGIFSDDFFSNFFAPIQKRHVEVTNQPQQVHVISLPEEGKLKNFKGAIGQFEMRITAAPNKLEVGDPLTLKVSIKGKGNFERVNDYHLDLTDQWKAYNPKASFESSDGIGYVGRKEFQQLLIPKNAGQLQAPPVEFIYLDPEKKSYVTLRSEAFPVAVQPSSQTSSLTSNHQINKGLSLQHFNDFSRPFISWGGLVWQKDIYRYLYGVTLFVILLGLGSMLVYRMQGNKLREQRLKKEWDFQLKERIERVLKIGYEGNAKIFFEEALNVLKTKLGRSWKMKPEAVTLADIQSKNDHKELIVFFKQADAVIYAGFPMPPAELKLWIKRWEDLIKEITHGI